METDKFRNMLYYLGYSSEDQVDEPLRSAIRRFDEVVVPLIYSGNPHLPTCYKAEMANQVIADFVDVLPVEVLAKMVEAALEVIKDDRGYPDELKFSAEVARSWPRKEE